MYKDLSPKDWFAAIEAGLKFRAQHGMEKHWSKLEELFYNVDPALQDENSAANLIYAAGDVLLSALTVPNPYIMVRPDQIAAVPRAPIVEQMDNKLVTQLRVRREIEAMVEHCYLWGVGIGKVGYDSEFGFDQSQQLSIFPGATLTQFDTKGNRIEFRNRVKPGMPWFQAVLPHDFVVPWGTGPDLESAPWAVHRVIRHIDDVKADAKYEGTRNLKPVMSMSDFVKSYSSQIKPYRFGESMRALGADTSSKSCEYVELWEIHDVRSRKVMVLATGHDRFIRNELDSMQVNGLPFVAFSFVPRARTFWVTPDAYYMLAAQKEMCDMTRQAKKQRAASVLKGWFVTGAIDEDEIEKLTNGRVGALIRMNQGQSGPNSIGTFPATQHNLLLAQEKEFVRRDARETIGYSRNQAGEFDSSSRRTATEAMVVDRASMSRSTRRQLAVRDAYIDAFEKINPICFAYWSMPRVVNVIGEDGVQDWVSVTGNDLVGDYTLGVGFSDEGDLSLSARRQQALGLYQLLAQDPAVDQLKLRQYIASAFNDPEFRALFRPGVLGNANLPVQMSQSNMPGSPGGGQAGGSPQPMPAMSGMSNANGA